MTKDVRKDLEKYLQENPEIAKLLKTMQKSQADYVRMLTLLGVRQVITEAPSELAVFLATVQIQMDRFLPGTPACGGPIDVLVLQTVPTRAIISFPGKKLHHPINQ